MSYRPNMDDHEGRLNQEINQLVLDIRRIGPTYPDPQPYVLFGELFDDEQVEQYYEALVGTLKSAKKRGIINFKGQILFKGVHDKVVISIVNETPPPPKKIGENGETLAPTKKDAASVVKPISPKPVRVADRNRRKTIGVPPSFEKKGSFEKKSNSPQAVSPAADEVTKTVTAAKTPPPIRTKASQRRWGSTRTLSTASRTTAPAGAGGSAVGIAKKKSTTTSQKKPVVSAVPPPIQTRRSFEEQDEDKSVSTAATAPPQLQPVVRARPPPIRKTSSMLSEAANERVAEEIARLPRDITRIQPEGEPWCLFGDLFDDDDVQQHYEALVGTLKSAKKRGVVRFKGQMLLKGMHDRVKVEIVQERETKGSAGSKAGSSVTSEKKKEEKASIGVVSGEVTQEV